MMVFIIILIAIVILCIFYVMMSLVTIRPNETGLLISFGSLGKKLEPGLRFCPWLISEVVKYEKTPLIFELELPTAITARGLVKGMKDEDGAPIERTELSIFLTLTTYFDHSNLHKTATNAPGNDVNSIGPIIEPFILGVLRSIASEMPWPLFYGERTKLAGYVLSKIIPSYEYFGIDVEVDASGKKPNVYRYKEAKLGDTPEISDDEVKMERYNPLIQFGLDMNRTTLEIQDMNFSDPEMQKIFNSPEIARLKGDADVIASGVAAKRVVEEGAARAEVIKLEGKAKAEARKAMISEIKDNTDLEYLRTLEEMAKGTSNTILYQIPKAFEEKISNMLGGAKPEDFFGLLKDEKIVMALKEALEKLTKK